MSFNKPKNFVGVGGKHYSATTNIRRDITVNKKTGLPVKLLRGTCTTCKRNKSLTVSDRTINGEGLGDFFKHLGKSNAKAAKNAGKKILNIPGRALELAAIIGSAAACKNPKLIAATAPDVIKFVHQGKGLFARNNLFTAQRKFKRETREERLPLQNGRSF